MNIRHHRYHTIATSCLLVALMLLVPEVTFAQESGGAVEQFLYKFVITVFGFFMGIGAAVLNWGINEFVIGFGETFVNSGIGFAIDGIWVFMRDLFNLTFIFGLVYIGFKMILNSGDSQTKKMLANIIIAALLVNFSLFFTKAFVDISNYMATELLNAGVGTGAGTGLIALNDGGDGVDIGESMMQQMRLMTAINGTPDYTVSGAISGASGRADVGLGLIFGTAFLFAIATFIFFATGIMFITRALTLLLYMAFSPFLFIGMVFPALQSEASKHVKRFISRSLFAPVYAALLFVILSLINAIVGPGGSINYGAHLSQASGTNATEFGTTFGLFILICGLLIATLKIAKQMGNVGAETALKAGNNLQRNIKGAAAGIALRRVNRLSEATLNLYDRMGNSTSGRVTRGLISVGSLGVLGSKNVRGGLAAGTKASYAGSETIQQVRDRQKSERKAATAASEKVQRDRDARGNDPTKRAAAIREMSADEIARRAPRWLGDKMTKEKAASLTDATIKAMKDSGALSGDKIKEIEKLRNEGEIGALNEKLDSTTLSADKLDDAFKELGQTVKSMSGDRAQTLDTDFDKETGGVLDERIAYHISDSQLETWEKDNKFTPDQIKKIKTARNNARVKVATKGTLAKNTDAFDEAAQTKNRRAMFSKGTKESGKLSYEVLKAIAEKQPELVTPEVMRERLENGFDNPDQVKGVISQILTAVANYRMSGETAKADQIQKAWEKGWEDNPRNSVWNAMFPFEIS